MSEQTYWNGEPCEACIVTVVVGKAARPTWWCAPLEGQEREAVEVKQSGHVFYIDNEGDGSEQFPKGVGWQKVTIGRGSPRWGHLSLPVASIVAYKKP
jgi:hypothetical protein